MSDLKLGRNGKQGSVNTENLKAGIKKEQIKDNAKLQTIFDSIDGCLDGKKDGVIDAQEMAQFKQKLMESAGKDETLSTKEAGKFIKKEGIKNIDQKELFEILEQLSQSGDNIQESTVQEKNGQKFIHIKYKDGSVETINPDKSSQIASFTEGGGAKTAKYDKNHQITEETVETKDGRKAVTSFKNGKASATVITDKNKPGVTSTIKYDAEENPVELKVETGSTEENYIYVDGKPQLTSKIENKGLPAKEIKTEYTYNDDGTTTEISTETKTGNKTTVIKNGDTVISETKVEALTGGGVRRTESKPTENGREETVIEGENNITKTSYNKENKALTQTKTIDGQEYKVDYDGEGNTKGIIVQNGESIAVLAKKFGCTEEDIKNANQDLVKGKGANVYFLVGQEIKIPKELEADDKTLQGRATKEQAIAGYEEYAAKKAAEEAAKLAEQEAAAQAEQDAAQAAKEKQHRAEMQKQGKEIAKDLFNDIDGIGTSKTFGANIQRIKKENVVEVIQGYTEKSPEESITEAILDEAGMSTEDCKAAIKHIFDQLIARAEEKGVEIDTAQAKKEFEEAMKLKNGYANNKDFDPIFNTLCAAINGKSVLTKAEKEEVKNTPSEKLQENTTTLLQNTVDGAEEALNQQLAQDGWAADLWEGMKWCVGSDNLDEKVKADIDAYKKQIAELNTAKTPEEFKAKFKKIYGIEYDPELVKAYEKRQEQLPLVEATRGVEENFNKEMSNLLASDKLAAKTQYIQTSSYGTGTFQEIASKEEVYNDELNKFAEFIGQGDKEAGIKDIEKAFKDAGIPENASLDDKYKALHKLAKTYSEILHANTMEATEGKGYDAFAKEAESSYKAAFGLKNDIAKRVADYNTSQKTGDMIVKGIVKGGAAIGLCLIPGVGLAAAAIGTGIISATVDTTDRMSSEVGLQEGELTEILKNASIDGATVFAGGQLTKMLANAKTFVKIGGQITGDLATGVAAEKLQTGTITLNGVLFQCVFSAAGNMVAIKNMGKAPKEVPNTPKEVSVPPAETPKGKTAPSGEPPTTHKATPQTEAPALDAASPNTNADAGSVKAGENKASQIKEDVQQAVTNPEPTTVKTKTELHDDVAAMLQEKAATGKGLSPDDFKQVNEYISTITDKDELKELTGLLSGKKMTSAQKKQLKEILDAKTEALKNSAPAAEPIKTEHKKTEAPEVKEAQAPKEKETPAVNEKVEVPEAKANEAVDNVNVDEPVKTQSKSDFVSTEDYSKLSNDELIAEYTKLKEHEASGTIRALEPSPSGKQFGINSHDMSTEKRLIREELEHRGLKLTRDYSGGNSDTPLYGCKPIDADNAPAAAAVEPAKGKNVDGTSDIPEGKIVDETPKQQPSDVSVKAKEFKEMSNDELIAEYKRLKTEQDESVHIWKEYGERRILTPTIDNTIKTTEIDKLLKERGLNTKGEKIQNKPQERVQEQVAQETPAEGVKVKPDEDIDAIPEAKVEPEPVNKHVNEIPEEVHIVNVEPEPVRAETSEPAKGKTNNETSGTKPTDISTHNELKVENTGIKEFNVSADRTNVKIPKGKPENIPDAVISTKDKIMHPNNSRTFSKNYGELKTNIAGIETFEDLSAAKQKLQALIDNKDYSKLSSFDDNIAILNKQIKAKQRLLTKEINRGTFGPVNGQANGTTIAKNQSVEFYQNSVIKIGDNSFDISQIEDLRLLKDESFPKYISQRNDRLMLSDKNAGNAAVRLDIKDGKVVVTNLTDMPVISEGRSQIRFAKANGRNYYKLDDQLRHGANTAEIRAQADEFVYDAYYALREGTENGNSAFDTATGAYSVLQNRGIGNRGGGCPSDIGSYLPKSDRSLTLEKVIEMYKDGRKQEVIDFLGYEPNLGKLGAYQNEFGPIVKRELSAPAQGTPIKGASDIPESKIVNEPAVHYPTPEEKMAMGQIGNNINRAKTPADIQKAQEWLNKMPECELKEMLQKQLDAKYKQLTPVREKIIDAAPISDYSTAAAGTRLPKNEPVTLTGSETLILANYELDLNAPNIQSKLQSMKNGDKITVGRDGDIKIDGHYGYVSGKHLTIEKSGNYLIVTDMSTNGTKIGTSLPKLNENELVRVAGNNGKPVNAKYIKTSREARAHLNDAIASGKYTESLDSYIQTMNEMHVISVKGKSGHDDWYGEVGQGSMGVKPGVMREGIARNRRIDSAIEVEGIAKKYGDSYRVDKNSRVKLEGIPNEYLPYDIEGGYHFYPDGKSLEKYYYKEMHRTSKETLSLIQNGASKDQVLRKIAEHYQYAANARPYSQINNSLFMNEINTLLTKAGLKTMPHGILDIASMHLQPESFKKYFIDQYNATALS